MPGDRRAPIVADNDEPLMTERVRQIDDVVRQIDDVVGFDLGRTIAAAVAALVGRGDLEPGVNKRINLMSPKVPALREAVQENDQGAFAFDYNAQPDAVRFDQSKIAILHIVFQLCLFAALAPQGGLIADLFANFADLASQPRDLTCCNRSRSITT